MQNNIQNKVLTISGEALEALRRVKKHGEFRNYSVAIIRAVKAFEEREKNDKNEN